MRLTLSRLSHEAGLISRHTAALVLVIHSLLDQEEAGGSLVHPNLI